MDRTELIRAKVFPGAQKATEDCATYPWHFHAHAAKSSQVLAIDVFGTIKSLGSPERDAVLAAVAGRLGLPVQGQWEVIGTPLKAAVVALHMRDKDEFIITKNASKPALDAIRVHLAALKAADASVPWAGSGNRAQYVRHLEKSLPTGIRRL